jgi:hypothetical protein
MLKRKGLSMPFAHTAALVLGVLGLLVGIQAISNIHNQSLDPNSNKVNRVIDSLGTTTVDIGGTNIPDRSLDPSVVSNPEKLNPSGQFRGVMAFNMLSAVDCDMVMAVNSYIYTGEDSRPGRVQYFVNGSGRGGWRPVIRNTSFQGNCFGAKSIDLNPVDDFIQNINPLTADESENANDMEGRYGRINFNVNTTFVIGDGNLCDPQYQITTEETTYERADYTVIDSTFEVTQRHLTRNCSEILMGVSMNHSDIAVDSGHPGFWHGARNAVFVPGGLDWDEENGNFRHPWTYELYHDEFTPSEDGPCDDIDNKGAKAMCEEELSEGDEADNQEINYGNHESVGEHDPLMFASGEAGDNTGEYGWEKTISDKDGKEAHLYQYRVRMINTPMVFPPEPAFEDVDCTNCEDGEEKLELFIEQAQYIFCDGTNGFMQSNAQSMHNGGEASKDVAYKEDQVYPRAEITGGGNEDCLMTESRSDFFADSIEVPQNKKLVLSREGSQGRTCNLNDVIERGDSEEPYTEEFNWFGGKITLQCGLLQGNYVDFQNWKGPAGNGDLHYYTPAWFVEECPEVEAGEDQMPEACIQEDEQENYPDKDLLGEEEYSNSYDQVDEKEYWEPGEKDDSGHAYLYVSITGSQPALTWDLPEHSGTFVLKLSPDTEPSPDGDGQLYIHANADEGADGVIKWNSNDEISYASGEEKSMNKYADETNWTIKVDTESKTMSIKPESSSAIERELEDEEIDSVKIRLTTDQAQAIIKDAQYVQ